MIVAFILERQMEGIQRLLAENVYSAAYPLHDVIVKLVIQESESLFTYQLKALSIEQISG